MPVSTWYGFSSRRHGDRSELLKSYNTTTTIDVKRKSRDHDTNSAQPTRSDGDLETSVPSSSSRPRLVLPRLASAHQSSVMPRRPKSVWPSSTNQLLSTTSVTKPQASTVRPSDVDYSGPKSRLPSSETRTKDVISKSYPPPVVSVPRIPLSSHRPLSPPSSTAVPNFKSSPAETATKKTTSQLWLFIVGLLCSPFVVVGILSCIGGCVFGRHNR